MQERFPLLRQVRVASPCGESWQGMEGDERVRFCAQCQHKVYNLSEMTAKEAEGLLKHHEGRICVRYYQRPDGTVMTRDCPVGLAKARRAFRRGVGLAVGLLASALGIGCKRAEPGYSNVLGDPYIPQKADVQGKVAIPAPTTGIVSSGHSQGEPTMGTPPPIH